MVVLLGCASWTVARAGRGAGVSQVFSASHPVVWAKAQEAVRLVGLTVVRVNEDGDCILAEAPITRFSYGEPIAVFVDSVDGNHVRVEVISRKKGAANIPDVQWERKILAKLDELMS